MIYKNLTLITFIIFMIFSNNSFTLEFLCLDRRYTYNFFKDISNEFFSNFVNEQIKYRNVNMTDDDDRYLLFDAVRREDLRLVQALLNAKAKINNRGVPVILACRMHNSTMIAELLLKFGADINEKYNDNQTVLIGLIMGDSTESPFLKWLLSNYSHIININEQDKEGNTALHYTAMFDQVEIAKLLMLAGADTTIKNNKDETFIGCIIDLIIVRNRSSRREKIKCELLKIQNEVREQIKSKINLHIPIDPLCNIILDYLQ